MARVVLDCERMKYVHTGLFHFCLNLGLSLKKLVKGHSKTGLSYFFPSKAPRYFGKDVKYIHQNSLRKFLMPPLGSHDIWHATFQNSQYLPKRNKNIRVVLNIHDLNFMHEDVTTARREKYLRHLQNNIDRSDVIVCVSEFSKNDVRKYCNTRDKELKVVYNGTNNLETPMLLQKSYKPSRPFLFCIGVINKKKNYHTLLPLLEKKDDLELVIAGRVHDNEYHSFLQESARKMKIGDRVRIVPDISEQEKSWYFNNCYAFVMPSIAEGFGLPVTEAMSVGKPTFLSGHTALPEIGGDKAFYFHDFNADNMVDVLEKGMERYHSDGMQEKIIEHSSAFNWNRTAETYLDIYRSLA